MVGSVPPACLRTRRGQRVSGRIRLLMLALCCPRGAPALAPLGAPWPGILPSILGGISAGAQGAAAPTWHETQEQEQAGAVPCHDAAAVPGGEEEQREQRRLRGDEAARPCGAAFTCWAGALLPVGRMPLG